ncbi:hypothetical protein MODO_0548 [Myroides odoratimimus]|uniref:Uncharacterized protein n=1 Tax=Myroides odoratimimus CCUG 10230 TaxID=883150 RepID=A0ABN0EC43_9FLAO|nr:MULTISPECIES: hypothetical protein [Myroides]AJA68336.1 hypothetical protein MYRA21_1176 [Myroides sp. A21]APA91657.1 hypothetical protein BK054_05400 [Myroides sp. ZB35]EHO10816.1 hypothetical protein HMPREF9712_01164 [Myroides odoratimimus CCUG 10230]MCS7473184.1 hypothetical protein [Myroides odoratimimus]MDM1065877.1 hypothetical protein [Myroides odoratimimus]
MKESDVPQDKSSLKENDIKELCYAVNDDGEYVTALSSGWETKTIVQEATLSQIEERVNEARHQVIDGVYSPIVYYMEVNRMDMQTLCAYVSMWKWRVKRHFKPTVFNKLSNTILQRYADAFGITVAELKAFKGKE